MKRVALLAAAVVGLAGVAAGQPPPAPGFSWAEGDYFDGTKMVPYTFPTFTEHATAGGMNRLLDAVGYLSQNNLPGYPTSYRFKLYKALGPNVWPGPGATADIEGERTAMNQPNVPGGWRLHGTDPNTPKIPLDPAVQVKVEFEVRCKRPDTGAELTIVVGTKIINPTKNPPR